MARKRLRVTLEPTRGGGAVFVVPFDVKQAFGRARAPVVVTIRGYSFRTTTAVMGGRQLVGVNKANRAGAGVKIGDRFEVQIEPDTAPRVVTPPADLERALAASARARAAWERLSYTHRREHVTAIEEAKRAETRARRIAKAIVMLEGEAGTDAGGDPVAALLAGYPEPLADLARRLQRLVRSAAPQAEEKVQRGWKTIQFLPPGGRWNKRDGCAIVLRKDRVDLALPDGANMDAPPGLLEGAGKAMRHIKIARPSDIKTRVLKQLVRQSMKSS